jgi:hypothetical protein
MLRRLLACLVALAIALPSAAMSGSLHASVPDCECPDSKKHCDDQAKACECGPTCPMRSVVADPAVLTATVPVSLGCFTASRPMMRASPAASAPRDAPFRPPRSTILL